MKHPLREAIVSLQELRHFEKFALARVPVLEDPNQKGNFEQFALARGPLCFGPWPDPGYSFKASRAGTTKVFF